VPAGGWVINEATRPWEGDLRCEIQAFQLLRSSGNHWDGSWAKLLDGVIAKAVFSFYSEVNDGGWGCIGICYSDFVTIAFEG